MLIYQVQLKSQMWKDYSIPMFWSNVWQMVCQCFDFHCRPTSKMLSNIGRQLWILSNDDFRYLTTLTKTNNIKNKMFTKMNDFFTAIYTNFLNYIIIVWSIIKRQPKNKLMHQVETNVFFYFILKYVHILIYYILSV